MEHTNHRNFDVVDRPYHYASGAVECIDAMVSSQGVSATMSFCLCNAFKYIWRCRNKHGIEDVRKAVWYLNKYIDLYNRVGGKHENTNTAAK